jgi:hypothetical protein
MSSSSSPTAASTRRIWQDRAEVALFVGVPPVLVVASIWITTTGRWLCGGFFATVAIVSFLIGLRRIGFSEPPTTSTTHHGRTN